MANGDITKETEYDKIEVVSTWHVQVRQATKIMEEQADGSKVELSRSFHRHVLSPFKSVYTPAVAAVEAVIEEKDSDGNVTKEAVEAVEAANAFWTHTATDISGEDASVQAIANVAWTDTVKTNYKTYRESQSS